LGEIFGVKLEGRERATMGDINALRNMTCKIYDGEREQAEAINILMRSWARNIWLLFSDIFARLHSGERASG
jgi:hypothetical protein